MRQGVYWILTIPVHEFTPYLPQEIKYIKGQLERGNQTDFLHWQILIQTQKKCTLSKIVSIFGSIHAELTRSSAADNYVFKDDTAVPNTRFELGHKSLKRNSASDWDEVRRLAETGNFNLIPSDILIRNYSSLKRIHVDNIRPVAQEKEVYVYWGKTGTGKSKSSWEEASFEAYPKSPTTIWWCGYNGQANVVIDGKNPITNTRIQRTN